MEVNKVRKGRENMKKIIKDFKGMVWKNKTELSISWKGYFKELLNVKNNREMEMNCLEKVREGV